jgi:ABC-type sugar transport system permease subunit
MTAGIRKSNRNIISVLPVIILIFFIGLAPFISAFFDSFFHDYYGERSFAGMENFRFILGDSAFPFSFNITVIWALLNVCFALLFGFLLALRLINIRRKKGYLHRVLLIPMGIPVYIAIPLWRFFLHGNGGISLITRITGLKFNLMMDPVAGFAGSLIVSLWLSVPITAFVFSGHMGKVSRSVIEAARIDGASEGIIARYIFIPEIRETLLAMGVLSFIKSFKEFTLLYMMTAGGPPLISGITERHIVGATTTLGVFLYEIFLQTNDWGINAAYALIMAVIVLFIMILWIMIKKECPLKFFLLLMVPVLAGGTDPLLIILAAASIFIALNETYHKAILSGFAGIHLLFTAFRIVERGFLAGFHPGIILTLLILLIRRNRRAKEIPTKFSHMGLSGGSRIFSGFFIAVTAAILYMLMWMSFSGVSAFYMDSLIPPHAGLNNFLVIFRDEGIARYFLNTLTVAGISALCLPLLVFPGAVFLNRSGSKKTVALLGFIQITGLAGGMHSLIPLYRLFRSAGLINTYIPLILIYLYHVIPFSLFILTAYLKTLPPEFRDLAEIEGMNEFAYSFTIVLPLSLPTIMTTIMAAFISAWNGFQAPLLFLNDEKLYTISLKLYSFVGNLGSSRPVWNLFAAASLVNTVIIGLIFIRFRKHMTYNPVSD